MNVQELAQDIEHEAEQQVASIKRATALEIKKREEETAKILAEKRRAIYGAVKRQEQEARRREEARQQLLVQLAESKKKQELLDDAFSAAADKIRELSGKEREQIIRKLRERITDDVRIEAAEQDKQYLDAEKTFEGLGGFIAYGDNVVYDMRFETLLEQVRTRKLPEIANVLFGRKR